MNNYTVIMDNPAFKSFSIEQKRSFLNVLELIKGKSSMDSIPFLIQFLNSMPKDKKFSNEEIKSMISVLFETMSSDEKEKMTKILKFMKIDV